MFHVQASSWFIFGGFSIVELQHCLYNTHSFIDTGERAITPESESNHRGAAAAGGEGPRIQEPAASAPDARGAGAAIEAGAEAHTTSQEDDDSSKIEQGQSQRQRLARRGEALGAADAIVSIVTERPAKPHFELTLPGTRPSAIITSVEPEACFFSPSDEKNLELSGALLSSPAMSRQGSPVLERLRLTPLRGDAEADANSSSGASSDSEPFTILARDPDTANGVGEGLGLQGGPGGAYLSSVLRRRGGQLNTNAHATADDGTSTS